MDNEMKQNISQEAEEVQTPTPAVKAKKRLSTHQIILIVLAVTVLACVIAVVYRFKNWGQFIGQDEIFQDGLGEYSDTFDMILPLIDAEGNVITPKKGETLNILLFGNAPFADDRDSSDGLANMIAQMTGANVINCSISGSYMASVEPWYNGNEPMDAFIPYWLVQRGIYHDNPYNDHYYEDAKAQMGDAYPAEADAIVDYLASTDLSQIDVFVFCYDGSDYLMGHPMYSDDRDNDIQQFTGCLEASIEELQWNCPNSRIIVLSPPYAFAAEKDENGEYLSSDIKTYGWDVLSTYVIKEYGSCASRQVTFVDNLYGTITQDNAKDYLIDNLHLNVAGRKKIAQRFVYALNYYDN